MVCVCGGGGGSSDPLDPFLDPTLTGMSSPDSCTKASYTAPQHKLRLRTFM